MPGRQSPLHELPNAATKASCGSHLLTCWLSRLMWRATAASRCCCSAGNSCCSCRHSARRQQPQQAVWHAWRAQRTCARRSSARSSAAADDAAGPAIAALCGLPGPQGAAAGRAGVRVRRVRATWDSFCWSRTAPPSVPSPAGQHAQQIWRENTGDMVFAKKSEITGQVASAHASRCCKLAGCHLTVPGHTCLAASERHDAVTVIKVVCIPSASHPLLIMTTCC